MKKYLVIVEDATGDIVKRVEVTGKSDRNIEKIERGMNINLNHNEYSVDLIEEYNE